MIHHPLRTSMLFGGSYIFLCSLYIWFSGKIAAGMASSLPGLQNIELYKGLAFVALTGIMILGSVYILLLKIRTQEYELEIQKKVLVESQARILAGTFAAGIAHDINNVLCSIDYGLDELRQSVPEDKWKHFIQITKAYAMVEEMVKRLQKIGRTPTSIEMKEIKVNDFIHQTVDFARRHRKLKTCIIRFLPEDEFELNVNPFLFEQMFINLMLNAADAAGPKGVIEIRAVGSGADIIIEFHDNGPGICDDQKELVLKPFHTTKADGTGLGLATVKTCVEIHHGSIEIDRSPLGGALFRVCIPTDRQM